MIYGYARVSTTMQDTARQEFIFKDKGYEIDELFEEEVSGTKKALEREKFKLMYDKLQNGDTIIFESLSRLGRNTLDIIETVEDLTKSKKVNLVFIHENLKLSINGDGLDAISTLIFHIFSCFAQLERDMLSDRVKTKLDQLKSNGVKLGRPSKDDNINLQQAVEYYLSNDMSLNKVSKIFDVNYNTLKKYVDKYKLKEK